MNWGKHGESDEGQGRDQNDGRRDIEKGVVLTNESTSEESGAAGLTILKGIVEAKASLQAADATEEKEIGGDLKLETCRDELELNGSAAG